MIGAFQTAPATPSVHACTTGLLGIARLDFGDHMLYLTADDLRIILPAFTDLLGKHDVEAELWADAERIAARDAELDGEQTEPDYV